MTFLALFASHLICLYLLSHAALSDSTSQYNPLVSRSAALICGKLYALWGAYGWEGLPFLAGALGFIRVRGLFRRPASRPRSRTAFTRHARPPCALRGRQVRREILGRNP